MKPRTWWLTRTARERQLAGYAILFVAPVLAWLYVLKPLGTAVRKARHDVAVERSRLDAEAQDIARWRTASRIALPVEKEGSQAVAQMFGDTTATGEDFGSHLMSLANDAGLDPELADFSVDSTAAALSTLSATLRFRGTLEDLLTLLTLLDDDEKLLTVPHLEVRSEEGYRASHTSDSTARLAISIVVQGLARALGSTGEHNP